MIDLYRILVSKGYGMADAGLSECLTLDMQVSQHHTRHTHTRHGSELTCFKLLAEVNTQYTFDILPLLYEYMPAYTIGNVELIKLLAAMIVPDQVALNPMWVGGCGGISWADICII